MLRENPITSWNSEKKSPSVSEEAYVDPSAVLIGDVRIDKGVYVAPQVVLRADEGSPIVIGEGTNVQDGVIMHALLGTKIVVGPNCSIAHGAILHGPVELEEDIFVGFRVLLFKCRIGKGSFIGHCASVSGVDLPSSVKVPERGFVKSETGVSALDTISEEEREFKKEVLRVNGELAKGYLALA
ncbi:MAG: hypothetical protein DRG83_04555 [Deltaproteobacteria bacterium]|nr:MAG: hypothetical protein DRG83_04555 [Deltaproteobacteria bacterium]